MTPAEAWREIVVKAMRESLALSTHINPIVSDADLVRRLVQAGFPLAEIRDNFDEIKLRTMEK